MIGRRVALVGPLKAWGGIEGKVVTLAREFLVRGIQVDLVLLRGGQTPYPDRLPSEVRVLDLESRSKPDGIPRLAGYLRGQRPDAVLTVKDHGAKVALLARSLAGIRSPIVIKVTNTLSQTMRRPAQRFMTRLIYPRADGIIAISGGVKEDLTRAFGIPGDRISVIYNPTVSVDFPERAAREPGHPWFEQDARPPVILGAGRLTHQKGFDVLLEAFAELRRSRPARLMILGDGPERRALAAQAQRLGITTDVALVGVVPDPLPHMARAALFVLSSRYEGLGNVLVEAMAVGCPVVSTDCPSGPREILADGRHGPLVPVENPRMLASAMAERLDQARRAEDLEAATRRFDSRHIADEYLRVLGLCPPCAAANHTPTQR